MSGETKSDFDLLLGEIGDLSKALPMNGDTKAADKKIDDAATDGADNSDADDADADKDVAKSFTLDLADGTKLEAVDGAALFKSLGDRVEKNEAAYLAGLRTLTDVVKSLVGQVSALGNKGTGRKAVLTINEKPAAGTDLNKAEPSGVTADEFFAKALSMQAAGTLSGVDVRRAEAYANAGKAIPAEIISKVLGAK